MQLKKAGPGLTLKTLRKTSANYFVLSSTASHEVKRTVPRLTRSQLLSSRKNSVPASHMTLNSQLLHRAMVVFSFLQLKPWRNSTNKLVSLTLPTLVLLKYCQERTRILTAN